jgi:hypothetical protein
MDSGFQDFFKIHGATVVQTSADGLEAVVLLLRAATTSVNCALLSESSLVAFAQSVLSV